MTTLCIYHKNCADGFGAALALNVYMTEKYPSEEIEWFPAHYGDDAPDVTNKNVFIVDFSYPREVLESMNNKAAELVVIDHHKTAQKELEGLSYCHFDMTKSGAVLTWEYLYPLEEVPVLLKYIQDRDLWHWKLGYSKEVSAGLALLPMSFAAWKPYLEEVYPLMKKGMTVLEHNQVEITRAVARCDERILLCGHLVPCVNTTTLVSEIGNELCKGVSFAVMYFDNEMKRVYSLRSEEGAVDVSLIAKAFGGGGHERAAGFSTEKPCHLLQPSEGQHV